MSIPTPVCRLSPPTDANRLPLQASHCRSDKLSRSPMGLVADLGGPFSASSRGHPAESEPGGHSVLLGVPMQACTAALSSGSLFLALLCLFLLSPRSVILEGPGASHLHPPCIFRNCVLKSHLYICSSRTGVASAPTTP